MVTGREGLSGCVDRDLMAAAHCYFAAHPCASAECKVVRHGPLRKLPATHRGLALALLVLSVQRPQLRALARDLLAEAAVRRGEVELAQLQLLQAPLLLLLLAAADLRMRGVGKRGAR